MKRRLWGLSVSGLWPLPAVSNGPFNTEKENHKTITGTFCTSVRSGLEQVPCSGALICQPLSEGFAIMEKH